MKEETEFRPKPMVSVGGRPILWHIMKIYAHFGFNKFIIALGYKGDYIKNYFLQQEYLIHDFSLNTKTGERKLYRKTVKDDFDITFVNTGVETLTGERLLRVKKYVKSASENIIPGFEPPSSIIAFMNFLPAFSAALIAGNPTETGSRARTISASFAAFSTRR